MGIAGENGNGNGREWESTSMGMGMTPIPMGICSHRPFSECKLQYSVRTCGGELWLAATALKVAYRTHRIRVVSCVFQPRRRQANAFSALPAGCSRNAEHARALTLQTDCCFYTAICRYKRRLRLGYSLCSLDKSGQSAISCWISHCSLSICLQTW